ncbi:MULTISPECIES: Sec-independent protein translocase TatB [Subtercola]|uniref:Sec-independent protein translocase TatB n=1 Tax=Subtercola TaxID=120212 RepID=UPI0026BC6FAE
MFGLTFEKLIIIGVIAAFVIGPERLPHYASVLAKFVRQLRDFTNGAKTRMKEEMGPDFDEIEWKKLDPRQYDPRRIIRDALLEDPEAVPVKPTTAPMAPAAAAAASVDPLIASQLPVNQLPVDPLAGDQPFTGSHLSPPEPAYLTRSKTERAEAAQVTPHDSEAT